MDRQPPPGGAGPSGQPYAHPDDVFDDEGRWGCSQCASLTFNAEWHKAFGVVLCNACKRNEELISKVRVWWVGWGVGWGDARR